MLKKDQLADFPVKLPFSFESDYLIGAVENSIFDLFVTTGNFIDIGVPEDYARAQIELAEKLSKNEINSVFDR